MPISPTPYLRSISFKRKLAAPFPHRAAATTGACSHIMRAFFIHLHGSYVLRVPRIAVPPKCEFGSFFTIRRNLAGGGPVRRTRHFILVAMLSPAVLFGCATTETIADKPVQSEYICPVLNDLPCLYNGG